MAEVIPIRRLLTIKELPVQVGGTVWYWRTQIWARRLPCVRVGRKILVDQKDVEQFISDNKAVA